MRTRLAVIVLLAIAACSHASNLILIIDSNGGNLIGSGYGAIITATDTNTNAFPGDPAAVVGQIAVEIGAFYPNVFDWAVATKYRIGDDVIPVDPNLFQVIIGVLLTVQGIEITGPADINDSDAALMHVNIIYNDGQSHTVEITNNIAWSVDDPNIATIDSNGVLRPVSIDQKTSQVTVSAAYQEPFIILPHFAPPVPHIHTNTFTVTIHSSLTDQQLAAKNLQTGLRLSNEIAARSRQGQLHLLRAAVYGARSKDISRSLRSLLASYMKYTNDLSRSSDLLEQTERAWSALLPPESPAVSESTPSAQAVPAEQTSAFKLQILGPDRFADLSMLQFAAVVTYSDGTSVDVTNLVTWTSSNVEVAEPNVDGFFYLKSLEVCGKVRVILSAAYSENGETATASHPLEIISESSPEELALWNLLHANQIEFEIFPLFDQLIAAQQRALEYSAEVPAGFSPKLWNLSRGRLASALETSTKAQQAFFKQGTDLGDILEYMFDTITFKPHMLVPKKWFRPRNPKLPDGWLGLSQDGRHR